MITWKDYLNSIYLDPFSPASFQGVDKIYKYVKSQGQHNISRDKIQKWLNDQDSYSLNKHIKRKFKRGRVIVAGMDDQWEADLADMTYYSKENDGVKYLLVVIDVFTRYGWVEPLKDKSSKSIVAAFNKIATEDNSPNKLRTDGATDFSSKAFQKNLRSFDPPIVHIVTHNDVQANFVERFIKTIKNKISRYITQTNQSKYIDMLQGIVQSYNNTWHSGIRSEPSEVSEDNAKQLWWQMYWPKSKNKKLNKSTLKTHYKKKEKKMTKLKKLFKFKIGDKVRISTRREKFQREYDSKWTGEVFKIHERFIRQKQPLYKVVDWFDDPLQGTFYQGELQKVSISDDHVWKIEKVVKRKNKGKQLLVKWLYWPKKFNSWINSKDYKNYK